MDDTKVSQRDVDTAIEMGAPVDVLDSLQRGEWPRPSTRYAIRYAEVAKDHMEQTYGMSFVPYWAGSPGFLQTEAQVMLRVVGGEYDGTEAEVRFDGLSDEPEGFKDNLWTVCNRQRFSELGAESAGRVFSEIDPEFWAVECDLENGMWPEYLDPATPFPEAGDEAWGHLWVYVDPRAGLLQEDVDELGNRLIEDASGIGIDIFISVSVLAAWPEEGQLTVDYVYELARNPEHIGKMYSYEFHGYVE